MIALSFRREMIISKHVGKLTFCPPTAENYTFPGKHEPLHECESS